MIGANARGQPVQSTTSTKMSQTWFASHTGAIDASIKPRAGSPRRELPANRSQKPAPKSAPANNAYSVMPTNITAATTSGRLMVRVLLATRGGANERFSAARRRRHDAPDSLADARSLL